MITVWFQRIIAQQIQLRLKNYFTGLPRLSTTLWTFVFGFLVLSDLEFEFVFTFCARKIWCSLMLPISTKKAPIFWKIYETSRCISWGRAFRAQFFPLSLQETSPNSLYPKKSESVYCILAENAPNWAKIIEFWLDGFCSSKVGQCVVASVYSISTIVSATPEQNQYFYAFLSSPWMFLYISRDLFSEIVVAENFVWLLVLDPFDRLSSAYLHTHTLFNAYRVHIHFE